MLILETLLLLLGASVVLALVARRLNVPSAVMLVAGGMALALVLVPRLPSVELKPELTLTLFLPPLLQASALRTDWCVPDEYRVHHGNPAPVYLVFRKLTTSGLSAAGHSSGSQ